jgi:2,4-dienoyl-CoA reductase-like NADH-dependent reductase (Old Yellow Enzyme family)
MCQFLCLGKDGMPGAWHLVNAGGYAAGGAGLVMMESTGVSPDARITDQCPGLWSDQQRDAWRPIADFVRSQGAVPGIQLNHSGRKGSGYAVGGISIDEADGGWQTIAPSAVPVEGMLTPREMTVDDIEGVIANFASAAVRAVHAGFDVIELHAAHGYLLHQFLSPLSNLRTDEFGGGLENRARLLLEVIRRIRELVPESLVLFVRFSGSDWVEGGWTPDDTATVATWAHALGADLFDISSGGILRAIAVPSFPCYQVPFAETVRQAGLPTAAVGKITTVQQAEAIVAEGKADAIFLARQLINDPHFPLRAAHELGVDVDYIPEPHRTGHWS